VGDYRWIDGVWIDSELSMSFKAALGTQLGRVIAYVAASTKKGCG
jgi:hypothetical protein